MFPAKESMKKEGRNGIMVEASSLIAWEVQAQHDLFSP